MTPSEITFALSLFFLIFPTLFTPQGTQTCHEHLKAVMATGCKSGAGMSFATFFCYFLSQPCIRIMKWAHRREYVPTQAPPLARTCGLHRCRQCVPCSPFSFLNSYAPHSLSHDNATQTLGHTCGQLSSHYTLGVAIVETD